MWTDQDRTRGSALYVSFSFEGAAAVQLGEDEGVWRWVGLFLDSSDLLITGLNGTVYVLTEGETLIRTKARLLALSGQRSGQLVWILSVDPSGLILSHLVGQSAGLVS